MSIHIHVEDAIACITIDRPERRNALDQAHYDALSAAWCQVRDDQQIRAAVITGAGDQAFCAGADLKSFVGAPPSLAALALTQKGPLLNRGLEVWKPVVAAVNGYCLGGGMTLLLATDIRVCVPTASFGLTEVKRGVFPANGGTQRVARQLPHAIAMELLLLGDAFDAERAERWGLVNRIVPAEQLMPQAMDYARRLAANAPLAVQAAKELALRDLSLADGLRMEQLFLRVLQGSEDVAEGVRAFSERRDAVFTGR